MADLRFILVPLPAVFAEHVKTKAASEMAYRMGKFDLGDREASKARELLLDAMDRVTGQQGQTQNFTVNR